MDSLIDILAGFRDPAVREWGRRVIKAAYEGGFDSPVGEGVFHGFLEEPDRFDAGERASLLLEFWRAYKAVVNKSQGLVAQSQVFASQFGFFRRDPLQILAEEFKKGVSVSFEPIPSMIELARKYPSIVQNIELLRQSILEFGNGVSNPHFKDLLNHFDAELEEIAKTSFSSDRLRLFEIGAELERARSFIDMDRTTLFTNVADILRDMMFVRNIASMAARQRLDELRTCVMKEFNSMSLSGGARDFVDNGIREAAAEMSIRVSELMRIVRETGSVAKVVKEPAAPVEPLSFEDLSVMAHEVMSTNLPTDVLAWAKGVNADPSMVDAALLDAAFRRRMGADSSAYAEEIGPFIRRVLVDGPMRQGRMSSGAALAEGGHDEIANGNFAAHLIEAYDSDVPSPLHLELGGGDRPAGLALARELPQDRVFSVDPQVCDIVEKAISIIGFMPDNFVGLRGRAQGLVPYFFKGPLFESALMFAPPSYGWVPMMLSALLAVKPEGTVDIYKFNSKHFDYDFLRRAGFGVFVTPLQAENSPNLISGFLRPGVPINHVRITVPMFNVTRIRPMF